MNYAPPVRCILNRFFKDKLSIKKFNNFYKYQDSNNYDSVPLPLQLYRDRPPLPSVS
jgi:hypothetical protein